VPATIVAAAALTLTMAPPASATPPDIPGKATAQSELSALTVTSEGSMSVAIQLAPLPLVRLMCP
jgi:hypothetical protein